MQGAWKAAHAHLGGRLELRAFQDVLAQQQRQQQRSLRVQAIADARHALRQQQAGPVCALLTRPQRVLCK